MTADAALTHAVFNYTAALCDSTLQQCSRRETQHNKTTLLERERKQMIHRQAVCFCFQIVNPYGMLVVKICLFLYNT